jgi:hypothetical protein
MKTFMLVFFYSSFCARQSALKLKAQLQGKAKREIVR